MNPVCFEFWRITKDDSYKAFAFVIDYDNAEDRRFIAEKCERWFHLRQGDIVSTTDPLRLLSVPPAFWHVPRLAVGPELAG